MAETFRIFSQPSSVLGHPLKKMYICCNTTNLLKTPRLIFFMALPKLFFNEIEIRKKKNPTRRTFSVFVNLIQENGKKCIKRNDITKFRTKDSWFDVCDILTEEISDDTPHKADE